MPRRGQKNPATAERVGGENVFQSLFPSSSLVKEGQLGQQGDASASDSPPGGQRAPSPSPNAHSHSENPQPAWGGRVRGECQWGSQGLQCHILREMTSAVQKGGFGTEQLHQAEGGQELRIGGTWPQGLPPLQSGARYENPLGARSWGNR